MPVYVSDKLTATLGVVRGSPTPTRLIQWFRGSTVISGANASTYTITSDDLGQPISVRQTESNYFGSAVATSAATEDVQVFDPSILFSASEPGVWFDPTDAANLAWRRNQLTYSQQFNNAAWVKYQSAVTVNAATAPDSTMTATKLVPAAGLAPGFIYYNVAIIFPVGTVTTTSVYVKAAELGFAFIANNNNGSSTASGVCINLTTGALTNQGGSGTYSAVSVGNGWWRVSATSTTTTTVNSPEVSPLAAAGSYATYTGDGTSGIYIWGAQQEVGSVATTYQPITNLDNEVIAQFPNATLYQDSIGTIPVYAPEQPVGLMLDKSRGLVLGPELVVDGNFASATGWTLQTGWSVAGGKAVFTSGGGAFSNIYQTFTTVIGRSYRFRYDLDLVSAGNTSVKVYNGGGLGGAVIAAANFLSVPAIQAQLVFVATATTTTIGFQANQSLQNIQFDNATVKELPGNHATQSTAISRPLYGIVPQSGRRNLLTYSQDFTNAAWIKLATLGSTTETAPDGTATASVISNASNFQPLRCNIVASGDIVASISFKKTSGATYFPGFSVQSAAYRSVTLNTNTGVATARDVEPVPAGQFGVIDNGTFWRVWIRSSGVSVTYTYPCVNTTGGAEWTGGTGSQTIWGAQLEAGTVPTNYQKVTNDYDVTEAGVASVGYLRFDGTNDFMVTSTITPGTDKAQFFAGVRKVGTGRIVETSLNSDANSGSFYVGGNSTNYEMQLRGDTTLVYYNPATFNSPITNVVSCLFDIAGALRADEVKPRIDGVLTQTGGAGTASGGGNFNAYPLYIGSRAGTIALLNGQLFPIIVRFGPAMTSALVRTTENWVASKTAGVTLP